MIAFLHRMHALVLKELAAIFRDPRSRVILFVPVVLQSLVFGYVATFDLREVPYAVLDASRGPASVALLARLDGTGVFRRVAQVRDERELARLVDTEQALLAVRFPPDFERRVALGDAAPLQLVLDARNSTTAASAAAWFGAVVDAFDAERAQRAGRAAAPVSLVTRAWYNPNLETRWNLMPALVASLSMLQTLLLTALSVAREREQGTFDQLLVTPLRPLELMLGKALPPVAIGLAQATLVLLVTRYWFEVPMAGSLGALYAGLAIFVVAGVGIGLSISALSATMHQAMLYTFVVLMPMMLLSGLMTPIGTMPAWLQAVTLANPLRFGIDLARRIYLEGSTLGALVPDLAPLLVITAITLPAATWLFRHRLV